MKHEPMTQEQLDAIEKRLNRSTWTEGEPWDYAADDFDGWCVVVLEPGPGTAYVARGIEQGWDEGENDAALIAHAPQDLADLLAEVERLRARPTVDDAMVERAARALYLRESDWSSEAKWDRLPEFARESWRKTARAVLEAALGTGEGS